MPPILVVEFLLTNLTSCIEQYGILPKEISYSILCDVGLCYLHSQSPPIIYWDLSSNDVLMHPQHDSQDLWSVCGQNLQLIDPWTEKK